MNASCAVLKRSRELFLSILLLSVSALFGGCGQEESLSPQQIYGDDSSYYIALRHLKENNENEASRLFKKCAKEGSYYCARRSLEQLTTFGDVRNRIEACDELVSRYNDEDALVKACREYSMEKEYARIYNCTEKIDMATCSNELARCRLEALINRNIESAADLRYAWFTNRPLSKEHYKLYTAMPVQLPEQAENPTGKTELSPEDKLKIAREQVISFRIEVYRKDYKTAYSKIPLIRRITGSEALVELTPQIISDMGKACLYGSDALIQNARIFNAIAEQSGSKNSENKYYAFFYAGRLYDREGNSYSSAVSKFKKAMTAAVDDEAYDNALWYLLNSSLQSSTEDTLSTLERYASTWHNPDYFDDFFELLAPLMLSEGRWNDFYRVYKAIDGYASDASTAKYAYIYGRLVQEHLALPAVNSEQEAKNALTRALNSGTNTYYKVLAAARLNLSEEETEQVLCATRINKNFKEDTDAERLLTGYAAFGLPDMIYPEWQNLFNKGVGIGIETAEKLASFLRSGAGETNNLYALSIRIAAKTGDNSDKPLTKDELKLVYPRNYESYVQTTCKEFELDEEVLYALIRSESYFDPQVSSTAGAVGLTQLMEFTAGDIAQRLKKDNYSLKDPQTNIQFGAFYLAGLMRRLDGSPLAAFFSYNAGISRVRRWLQSSHIELGGKKNLAYDLFLETIPYPETREYGRKLVSASIMYGWLYYNKSVSDVAAAVVR